MERHPEWFQPHHMYNVILKPTNCEFSFEKRPTLDRKTFTKSCPLINGCWLTDHQTHRHRTHQTSSEFLNFFNYRLENPAPNICVYFATTEVRTKLLNGYYASDSKGKNYNSETHKATAIAECIKSYSQPIQIQKQTHRQSKSIEERKIIS